MKHCLTVRHIDDFKIKGYQSFELVRKESGGGGLATCVNEDLEPVLISEGDDQSELLVVEIRIDKNTI